MEARAEREREKSCRLGYVYVRVYSALMGEALGQGEPRRALTLLRTGCALTLILVLGYTTLMFFGRFWVASVLCGGVADVAAAYDALSPGLQKTLETLETVHRNEHVGQDQFTTQF